MSSKQNLELPAQVQSYWLESTSGPRFPVLDRDISVDVAVVGGGLAGISTAWFLKNEGLRVAVLEADRVCQGTTGHSTAKITSQHSLIYAHIQEKFGWELAQQYADANETAVGTMGELIAEQKIECDFEKQPAYVYTQQDKYVEQIQREAQVASDLGIPASYEKELDLPFPVKAAVKFSGQAQFHPRKYVLALAEQIPGDGSEIFQGTVVLGIAEGQPNILSTETGHEVHADKVVVASHFPFHDGLGFYYARMYPDRSYILGVRTPDKLPQGMYVSAESPGRSLRKQRYEDGEMLLVAGEHHKPAHGEPEHTHYQKLRDFAKDNFNAESILYHWSAQDYTSMDKIPYIGHIRRGGGNIYVATGFRKWGISTSTVSALILRDLIVWGRSPWQDVYSPQRGIKASSLGKLASINVDVAGQLVAGKLQRAQDTKIGRGEARVVTKEGRKLGAYRDEEGQLHVVDITCTHMGCELKWNEGEKSWDCPCHGSRFSYEGDIIEGPAVKPLQHFEENDIDPDFI